METIDTNNLPKLLALGILTIDVVCEHNGMAWPVFFLKLSYWKFGDFLKTLTKLAEFTQEFLDWY